MLLAADILGVAVPTFVAIIVGVVLVLLVIASSFSKFYRKVGPEEAMVVTGVGGLKVGTGTGIWVIPVFQRFEQMDLSVKRIEIARRGEAGLICKDNIRADIEVAFFVRVNNTKEDILQVAQSLGCRRASDPQALNELFNAKFSEALKTVGKHFDFTELYNQREQFKEQILKVIGTDLNGYKLDDCAIDYLEQTPIEKLNPMNILDAEGIKKITELTSREKVQENHFTREREKTIKKQDVEAAETIFELEKQRVEAEQKQLREIAAITSREQAEAAKVQEEERLRSERARIITEEEVAVAEENKLRQVIVARKSKERTDAVESERVEKDRLLEVTERERVFGLAQIEKDKAIELQRRDIQEVIRERVIVERAVVEEQERIKDTHEFAAADRLKQVTVTRAEMSAQESLVKEVKAAEASRQAADLLAQQVVIEAEAQRSAAEKQTISKKMLAEAHQAESAAPGLAEAQVLAARADAVEKHGTAEAEVMRLKFTAEATGIEAKAEAMKLFDGVGREHEEFKLRLNKDKDIEIAAIEAQRNIARDQSEIVSAALQSARIDIVGGETAFFDKIVDSIKGGKAVDRFVQSSQVLSDVKETFFDGNGDPDYFRKQLKRFVSHFGMNFEDIKDLSVSALIGRMILESSSEETTSDLTRILRMVKGAGVADKRVASLGLGLAETADKN
ncbi:MAG TPA: SPFH domain-containing protein [Planctomycetaceae bacterium]|nr:SPFH domain-containing protein [Planctomycetaceae bacterium]